MKLSSKACMHLVFTVRFQRSPLTRLTGLSGGDRANVFNLFLTWDVGTLTSLLSSIHGRKVAKQQAKLLLGKGGGQCVFLAL